jgi:hypothetical protein
VCNRWKTDKIKGTRRKVDRRGEKTREIIRKMEGMEDAAELSGVRYEAAPEAVIVQCN